MVNSAIHIKIRKPEDLNETVDSCVSELTKDKKHIYSYLVCVKKEKQTTIYCQLPVTSSNDPRGAILLKNFLKVAIEASKALND